MRHASCILHYASWIMHLASCTMHQKCSQAHPPFKKLCKRIKYIKNNIPIPELHTAHEDDHRNKDVAKKEDDRKNEDNLEKKMIPKIMTTSKIIKTKQFKI